MRAIITAVLCASALGACAQGGTQGPCFPVQTEDLFPQPEFNRGWTLVCSLDRINPGRRAAYIERYPFLAEPSPNQTN